MDSQNANETREVKWTKFVRFWNGVVNQALNFVPAFPGFNRIMFIEIGDSGNIMRIGDFSRY
jgi:hypothetical protein